MEGIKDFLLRWDLLGFVIAAIVSLLISLIVKGTKNLIIMKRKPYNISRNTISRTVYENRRDGDFSIVVSYKGVVYEEPLTIVRIRLLNDGENDINYINQCAHPILIEAHDADVVEAFIEPSNMMIAAELDNIICNDYWLTWELLKKDEFIDLVLVVKGKDFSPEQVHMSIRAEGIDKIKAPEYHVWPQLWPQLLFLIIAAIICWFGMPKTVTFIPYIPQNVFWAGLFIMMIPLWVITVLIKRIRWERE